MQPELPIMSWLPLDPSGHSLKLDVVPLRSVQTGMEGTNKMHEYVAWTIMPTTPVVLESLLQLLIEEDTGQIWFTNELAKYVSANWNGLS